MERRLPIATAALVALLAGLGTAVAVDGGPAAAAVGACGDPAVPAHDMQGNGAATPVPGQLLTLEAVVVGDYQGAGGLGGFYVQEESFAEDADPATSEGIFVASSATDVTIGDLVRAEGRPTEVDGETQLTELTGTLVCATGTAVTPAVIVLPVLGILGDAFERYEGMRISLNQVLTTTDVARLGSAGEVELSVGGRLASPTSEVTPGAAALALQDANDRRRILLDDGSDAQPPTTVIHPQGGLSAANTLRVGDTLPGLTGVLGFGSGRYRVHPVSALQFDHANPRPGTPTAAGGEAAVATYDLQDYFNGDGAGGGFPAVRGAATPAEFARQRTKVIAALAELDADVVGLTELENDDPHAGYAAIEDLVDGLNAVGGAGTYAFVDTGVTGGQATRVGIVYQPARVTTVGAPAVMDHTVDPRFRDDLNRPSLAQTFRANADGATFTVAVNDLKSKDSDCDAAGDPDTGDGQGDCNLTRTSAADALVDWLGADPTHSGDPDVLVLGELNAYAKEDPIEVFGDAGYVDTIAGLLAGLRYSSVTDGQSGYLDHALASPGMADQVTGVTRWHVNADEPAALDYRTVLKTPAQADAFYAPDAYRSSDHDPVLVGLDLDGPPSVDAGRPYTVVEGRSVTVGAVGRDPEAGPITYRWDLDGDGTYETAGRIAAFSAAALQAPASRTIGVRAVDPRGNTATDTVRVDVVWDFRGFLKPIAHAPKLNRVIAGETLRLRFRLHGDQGLSVLAGHQPTYARMACTTAAETGPAASVAKRVQVTYRSKSRTYSLVWKTSGRRTGCGRLSVGLADGTVHQAAFRFVRARPGRIGSREDAAGTLEG